MKYKTPEFVHRKGVVLSRELVPYDSALTFNAGVVRRKDDYVMLFRNDYGFCRKDFDDFYGHFRQHHAGNQPRCGVQPGRSELESR
ncbi:MAG: hypothetical protein IKO93_22585 [Lentisphaeria bacterium]|nr:hypothetical protein [Lentisphaeria bacterium]